jgi:hypothetical protein
MKYIYQICHTSNNDRIISNMLLEFNEVPIKDIKLYDIIKVSEYDNPKNGKLYMLTEYVPTYETDIDKKITKDLSYYKGQEVDDNLTVKEKGDIYEFDVGDDVQMVCNNKPSVMKLDGEILMSYDNFILGTRKSYDVLKYPYKTKRLRLRTLFGPVGTDETDKLVSGTYIKDENTGSLYKFLEFDERELYGYGDEPEYVERCLVVQGVNLDLTIKSNIRKKITCDIVMGYELNIRNNINTRRRVGLLTVRERTRQYVIPSMITILDL